MTSEVPRTPRHFPPMYHASHPARVTGTRARSVSVSEATRRTEILMGTMLVTGGTGTLGRLVVPLIQAAGWNVRVLSRHTGDRSDGIDYRAVDLLKGDGLDAAVEGVDVVLHLAGGPKGDDIGTRNLVAAAERAGLAHLVHISVTGVEQV